MSQSRRTRARTTSLQNDQEQPPPRRQLRDRASLTAQQRALPPGTKLYKMAFLTPQEIYDSLGQLLNDSNLAARPMLMRLYHTATKFNIKAVSPENIVLNGNSPISENTPLAAYLGQVHVEEDQSYPGIAYRSGLSMKNRGADGITRVYLEGERTVFDHPGDGVDEHGVTFNAAAFGQRCEGSNMKLIWTRPPEADKHSPDCMWILVAYTKRVIRPGEQLTIDRNEAAGSNYGFYHESKDSALLISMYPRNVSRCLCDIPCPLDRLYIKPALSIEQWERYDAALAQNKLTDQRARDRRMNDGGLAEQAAQGHGESGSHELDKTQDATLGLRNKVPNQNLPDDGANDEPFSKTEGGRTVQLGSGSKYDLTEKVRTNTGMLRSNDFESRRFEAGSSRTEGGVCGRSPLPHGIEDMGQGEAIPKDDGSNLGRRGNRVSTLSGQSLGESYQASETSNSRGQRPRNHPGKGGWPFPGDSDHEFRQFQGDRYARNQGPNFSVRGNGNAFLLTAGFKSQVSGPVEGIRNIRSGTWGFADSDAVTKTNSLRMGPGTAHDGSISGVHRELSLRNSISPSRLRFPAPSEPKIRVQESVKGNRDTERIAEAPFLSGYEGTSEENVASQEPYIGTRAGGYHHLDRDPTVLQSKRGQEFSGL